MRLDIQAQVSRDILDKQKFLESVRNASPELDTTAPKHGTNQLLVALPIVHKKQHIGNLSNILRLHGEIHEDLFDDLKELYTLVSQQTQHTHQIEELIHDILTLAREDGIRGAVYHYIISILMMDAEIFNKLTVQSKCSVKLKGEDESWSDALEVHNCVEARVAEIVKSALIYEPDVELFLEALAYVAVGTNNLYLFNSIYHLNRDYRQTVIDIANGLVENTIPEEDTYKLYKDLRNRCQYMSPIEYINLGSLYERAMNCIYREFEGKDLERRKMVWIPLPIFPEVSSIYRSGSAMGYLEVIRQVVDDGQAGHVQPLIDILNFYTQGCLYLTASMQTTNYFSGKAVDIIANGIHRRSSSSVFIDICEHALSEGMSGLSQVSDENMLRLAAAYHDLTQSRYTHNAEPILVRIREEIMKGISNANLTAIYEAHYLS